MSDLKISQMTDGGAVLTTDEIPVDRGGNNYRVKVGSAAAADTGTGSDDVPTNNDLGSAALVNVGSGPTEVPTNSLLGDLAYQDLVDLSTQVSGDLALAHIAQLAALSLLGNPTNATADLQAITAGTDGQVLRRSGTALAFGALNLAVAAAVTGRLALANIVQGAALSVLGVTGNATADFAAIAAGTDGQVLRRSGTALSFGAVALDVPAAVTGRLPYANLLQGAALSVLAVTGNATADWAALAASLDGQLLRRSGTALAFGALNLASANAVTGLLPLANTEKFVARTAYTPAWSSAGTQPALGNGSLTGSYTRNGDTIEVSILFSIGSTTTQGTGYWIFSLPVASSNAAFLNGKSVYAVNTGYNMGFTGAASTSTFFIVAPTGGAFFGVGSPVVWATGHVIHMNFSYMV